MVAAATLRQSDQLRGTVSDASHIAEIRRSGVMLATRLEFDETARARVALVVTELATNLLKHARTGEVLLRPLPPEGDDSAWSIEALSLDRGPGIQDIGRALLDGFSTAGSPGSGLGAIRRLASQFDLYSLPGQGTGFVARLGAQATPARPPSLMVGAVRVPAKHEHVSGDDWGQVSARGCHTFVLADGLGHGENAAVASRAAVSTLTAGYVPGPGELLEEMHRNLRSTRGAAVLVVQVDEVRGILRHAGIGNISGVLLDGSRTRHLVSSNGIVGQEARRVHELAIPCTPGWMLLMHSDGIGTRWNLDHYPGLVARDPSLTAGILYRDHLRGRDDATVLVARRRPG